MKQTMCTYPDRDDALIAYLYDEAESIERAAFDAHISACAICRTELAELRGLRTQLMQWGPPEPAHLPNRESGAARSRNADNRSRWTFWSGIPVWAQVAAATLILGVSAGIANLDVRYDSNGLSVRTGWSRSTATPASAAPNVAAPIAKPETTSAVAPPPTPWRADLAALEQRLRREFRALPVAGARGFTSVRSAAAAAGTSDADLLRRVRLLVEESERRQQRELALRVAELVRDVNAQRQVDLVKIDRSLGLIQRDTGVEAMKQREMINYLVRVSQRQ